MQSQFKKYIIINILPSWLFLNSPHIHYREQRTYISYKYHNGINISYNYLIFKPTLFTNLSEWIVKNGFKKCDLFLFLLIIFQRIYKSNKNLFISNNYSVNLSHIVFGELY